MDKLVKRINFGLIIFLIMLLPFFFLNKVYDNYFDINTDENFALKNQVLINCNCNFYKNFNSTYNAETKHSTYINSNTSYYNFNIDSKDNTIIGNKYGFIEGNSGNVIAIGQGIVLSGKKTDKIILGYYNSNTMDEDDLLVVGDGFLNETNTDLIPTGNWYEDENEMTKSEDDKFIVVDVSYKDFFDKIVEEDKIIEIIDHHCGYEEYWKNKK